MQTIISTWEWVSRSAKGLGPYLMLEILLPGGTLLALLLFLYQRYRHASPDVLLSPKVDPA